MDKPERYYWVKAEPANDGKGFVGVYGAYGLVPGLVRDQDKRPAIFPTEVQAEYAAHQRLLEVINGLPALARKHGGKQEKYLKPSGPEFAVLLSDAEVTATAFAYISGQKLSKMQEWLAGIDEKGNFTAAPHWARVLLEIFKHFPKTFEFALKLTDKHTTKN